MKKGIKALIIFLLFQACKQASGDFEKGQGDILYIIHDNKRGENIRPGDFAALSVIEMTEEGKILYNSNDYDGRPVYKFREPSRFKGDFFTGMGLLSEGDSATFKVRLDSPGNKDSIAAPTKGKFVVYHIKVHKVVSRGNLNDSLFTIRLAEYKHEEAEKARIMEPDKINAYIEKEKLKPVTRTSGLNYILIKQGAGTVARPGDVVKVNFTMRYLGGKVFETSSEEIAREDGIYKAEFPYTPAAFPITNERAASGFYEALTIFPGGTKAKLIIPSKLAFGNNYYKGLNPYTPLLCDLEILEILTPKSKQRP